MNKVSDTFGASYPQEDSRPAVLFMNFGGPPDHAPDTMERYIYNVIADRVNWPWHWARRVQPMVAQKIAHRRAAAVAGQYAAMGGGSPLLRWTETQRHKVGTQLQTTVPNARLHIGMQYWPPFIEEVLPHIAAETPTDLILLPLYPHTSVTTSSACCERVETWWRRHGPTTTRLHRCEGWYAHPHYLAACVALLRTTLAQFTDPSTTHILFTAHSLPQRTVDQGDVYPHQVRAQITALLQTAGITNPWSLGFQSRLGPVQWLEPSVEERLIDLASQGTQACCIMPLSFVADMLETLYEVDVTYMAEAHHLGFTEVRRVPVVNDHPMFIECLHTLIRQAMPLVRQAMPLVSGQSRAKSMG